MNIENKQIITVIVKRPDCSGRPLSGFHDVEVVYAVDGVLSTTEARLQMPNMYTVVDDPTLPILDIAQMAAN